MWNRRIGVTLLLVSLSYLAGCSSPRTFVAKDEPWRADEERRCLASNVVRASPFVTPRSSLGGPPPCGALQPLQVSAASNGRVHLKPSATLRCPMVPATDHWVDTVVIPAARHHLGQEVVELKIAASYACRPMNSIVGGRLSEHGLANALDVAAFLLADGSSVTVKGGWHGEAREQAFLRAVHQGACRTFTTVLGPNADRFHHDHFHFDLARHGRNGTTRICK
jgi:hypothetical protein